MNSKNYIRLIGVLGVALSVLLFIAKPSFPTPDKIVLFLMFVFMMFGQALELLRRFVPFVALLMVYESFRGIVPHLNHNVNYLWMPAVDVWFAGGQLPTVVLQNWWWHGHVQWYDFAFYITYMMHFILPFALAIVVWKLREQYYWRYVTAYITVSFAGFLTYLAFPAAPPWLASDKGLIPHISRISGDVWYALGVTDFSLLYSKLSPNPVAAVPSLHAAYATLFALFVFTLFRRSKWKYLSLVYPILIYTGTVYTGEHYLIDELLGGLYAAAAFFASPYVLRLLIRVTRKIAKRLEPLTGIVRKVMASSRAK